MIILIFISEHTYLPGEQRHLPWCHSCWWIHIQTWRWTISPCRSPCNWKSASFKIRSNLVENSPWWRSPPLQAPPPPSPAKQANFKTVHYFLISNYSRQSSSQLSLITHEIPRINFRRNKSKPLDSTFQWFITAKNQFHNWSISHSLHEGP